MNSNLISYGKIIDVFRNNELVARGFQFNDGKCVVKWEGKHQSIVIWNSLDDFQAVSGHQGTNFIIYDMLLPSKKCSCGLTVH